MKTIDLRTEKGSDNIVSAIINYGGGICWEAEYKDDRKNNRFEGDENFLAKFRVIDDGGFFDGTADDWLEDMQIRALTKVAQKITNRKAASEFRAWLEEAGLSEKEVTRITKGQ
ncbi:MAG: hypothetical protein LBQ51_07180 [Desulfovibrio sp.]|jgi:hypothetical protein|nr:hypothetical protein [Desulfovibrio sp.]